MKNLSSKNLLSKKTVVPFSRESLSQKFNPKLCSEKFTDWTATLPPEEEQKKMMTEDEKINFLSNTQWIEINNERYMINSLRDLEEEVSYCTLVKPFMTSNGIKISTIALNDISSQVNENGNLEGEIDPEKMEVLNIEVETISVYSCPYSASLQVSHYNLENNEVVFATDVGDEKVFTGTYKISSIYWDNDSKELQYEICKDFSQRDAVWTDVASIPSNKIYIPEKYTIISQEGGMLTGNNEDEMECVFSVPDNSEENTDLNKQEYLRSLEKNMKSVLKVVVDESDNGPIQDGFIRSVDPQQNTITLQVEGSYNPETEYSLKNIRYTGVLELEKVSIGGKITNILSRVFK